MAEELLPCPRCGAVGALHEVDWCEPPEWVVQCECRSGHRTKDEAIAAWNRRAALSALPRVDSSILSGSTIETL